MCTKSIYKENTPVHSQTCIKRSPLGQRKTGLIRGSIYIKFSMAGQGNGDRMCRLHQHLRKESLKSDSHQFNKYQQNEQSPLIPTKLTEHKKDHDI